MENRQIDWRIMQKAWDALLNGKVSSLSVSQIKNAIAEYEKLHEALQLLGFSRNSVLKAVSARIHALEEIMDAVRTQRIRLD